MKKWALESLSNIETKELAIIPGAGHLFEEPCKMEEVAQIAADWFQLYCLEPARKNIQTFRTLCLIIGY
jgi:hypothetical protein